MGKIRKKPWVQTDCPLGSNGFVRQNRISVTPMFWSLHYSRGLCYENPPLYDTGGVPLCAAIHISFCYLSRPGQPGVQLFDFRQKIPPPLIKTCENRVYTLFARSDITHPPILAKMTSSHHFKQVRQEFANRKLPLSPFYKSRTRWAPCSYRSKR